MAIKLSLKGFEDLIQEIEKAGASANRICDKLIREDAQIMQEELKSQMASAGVDAHLINDMNEPEVTAEGNRFYAKVGYEKGEYDPENPSNAYKVIFLNYGTPNRKEHGTVEKRGFIQKAKKRARTKINKKNKEAFERIIEGLK